MTETQRKNTTETHYLWWVDKATNKRQAAGVAFYEEDYGEYRLKIDIFPDNQYYLKMIGASGGRFHYRVEVILKKNGIFLARRTVGEGYSLSGSRDEVFIDLGPFDRSLVLSLKK